MKVFVIIVTYNGMKWIDRCLTMLRKSTIPLLPVIIDNCSTDDTLPYVKERYPEAVLFPQKQNLGFGQANNVGIRYALEQEADYCLLLNQDAYLQPDAMQYMLEQSDGESLISPLHLNGTGERLDHFFRISLQISSNELFDDLLLNSEPNPVYDCGEICAACWLLPRKIIENVGGFNPIFFHYSEDNNYYHRLVYHKVKVRLVPAAKMWHDRGIYGNVQAFNRNRLHRDFMLSLTNINHSLAFNIAKLFHVLLLCYKRDLPKHAYKPGAWFVEFMKMPFYIPRIFHSRKSEKKQGKTWL